MKVHHHVRAFELLLNNYDGKLPLHRFLISYFKQNKQMGSADRRWAGRYLYAFFRLGNALAGYDKLIRLAVGDFLCNSTPSLMVEAYLPALLEQIQANLEEKLNLVKKSFPDFNLEDVFRFQQNLSPQVSREAFLRSFFIQPDLFIRVRETHISAIEEILEQASVPFKTIGNTTLALPNGTKLEQVIPDQRLYQVQDLSSQKTGNWFRANPHDYWWDCCAASGGKSLLLHSLEPTVSLLVSDVRQTSLANLQERFMQAGIKKYHKKVLDMMQDNQQLLHDYKFDGILVDAPCSGSGTWGRTPEMLRFFEPHKLETYNRLQKGIVQNASQYLKPGKPLIYMTCSVFKAENEDIVGFLVENCKLKLEAMELITGYHQKADTLFVARLIKA